MSLNNIRIVMVRTFHPGNIGAVARAMKTMGLSELVLVDPVDFPHEEAHSRAAGATDVLERARIVSTVEEALADCQWVIATSARRRGYEWPMKTARAGMAEAYALASGGKQIAILFGPERSGLESETLRLANQHVYIPANPDYSVLNVSAAAQTLCYELWMNEVEGGEVPSGPNPVEYPKREELEHFYSHLEQVLRLTGFLIPQHPGESMVKLRRLFTRAQPETRELKMLRGILSSVERLAQKSEEE